MKIAEKFLKILNDKKFRNLCLVMEILLAILVFSTLTGGAGVDFDEAFSWDIIVNNGIKGIFADTAADVHPPLYYLIVKAAFALFGSNLKVMVWTSIVPVVLGMCMSSVLVRKRWGFAPALLFNLIFAFAPFILHYNLNLRMYSWMSFFVLGVILIGYEMTFETKVWHFIAMFLFSILAVYTQYFALLPIVICYIWLLIVFLREKKIRSLIGFISVGILDIVAYIPWLVYGMRNMGISLEKPTEEYGFKFSPVEIFNELFSSNLENGDTMAMVLFTIAIVIFAFSLRKYSPKEKSFIYMLLLNMVFCWYFSQWLGSLNGHFFASRYVIYCLVFMWLFMSITYFRFNKPAFVLFAIWSLELCLSSYKVEKSYEYDTTPLMPQTVAFIDANIEPDAIIVYDFDRWFNLIWQYYIPGHKFIHFDDLDLDEMKGQTFWVINLNGAWFSQEDIDEYSLEIEHNPGMGFMGMERFDLWKVTVGGGQTP